MAMLLKIPFFSLLGILFTNRFQGPILLAEQTKVLASKPNDPSSIPETPGGRGEPVPSRHLSSSDFHTCAVAHTAPPPRTQIGQINVEKCKCNAQSSL